MHDLRLALATPADAPLLEPMLIDFKSNDPVPRTERELVAFRSLLEDRTAGDVFRIEAGDRTIGYAILCWGYSVEYGGRNAFLDEFYVVPELRGRGLGLHVLGLLDDEARQRGLVALHLEVLAHEARNSRLYARAGFTDRGSRLMTRRLG